MAWIITRDLVAAPMAKPGTNANAVGVHSVDFRDDTDRRTMRAFRMRDDDAEIYYEGLSTDDDFAPLEDFGTPNAGCSSIEYLAGGEWEVL